MKSNLQMLQDIIPAQMLEKHGTDYKTLLEQLESDYQAFGVTKPFEEFLKEEYQYISAYGETAFNSGYSGKGRTNEHEKPFHQYRGPIFNDQN